MRRLFCVALGMALFATAHAARSQPRQVSPASGPRHPKVMDEGFLPEGWFVPVGVNLGGVSHRQGGSGAILGAEASLVLFPVGHGFWNGVYADSVYDTSNRRVRASTGVEFGYLFLGVDGGPLVELGETPVHAGLQIRPMLSLGLLHVYGRWGAVFGKKQHDDFREIGVLLKFPIQVVDARHTDGGRRPPTRSRLRSGSRNHRLP